MVQNAINFTYVIGYRHQQDRIMNLRKTLDWLSGFSGLEVIIVEQDEWSKISHLNLKARHVFVKSKLPYNRSWAFNVAIKESNTPIIIFGDSDLIMDPYKFIDSIKMLEQYDVVSPYKSVIDLDPNESSGDFNHIFSIDRAGRGENDNQKINLCGGIVMFKRNTILELGGWNQDFFGWGAEDNFQTLKVEKLGMKTYEAPHRCYHLWHTRATPDMSNYEKSMQILNYFADADADKIRSHINATIPRMGLKNIFSVYS